MYLGKYTGWIQFCQQDVSIVKDKDKRSHQTISEEFTVGFNSAKVQEGG